MNNEANKQTTTNNEMNESKADCPHEHTHVLTLGFYSTCEVTAVFCKDCGERLAEEKWDC